MRNAKIVCTLGPATDDEASVRALADAGMTVARINASHGGPADRRALVETTRAVDEETEKPLAVMLDTQGPEVRTAETDGEVEIRAETEVAFAEGETTTPERVGLSTSIAAAEPGDRVLLDDGRIEAVVDRVEGETVYAEVLSGGSLGSRKGVNVPGVELGLDVVTEKDRRDLELAADLDVDYVAASFVRDAEDVLAVNRVLESFGADIPIVAKIERAGAVENLDGIVEAASGVMVARGDLGVECPMEDVPMIQKRIIRQCRDAGVPVITATEMLDSMVHARRPTRAEASDVANAVLDGTDAVMLSGETAVGDHPTRVVETMDRIVREVEDSEEYAELQEQRVPTADGTAKTDALARSARYLARDVDASAVVVASESGYTARKAAKFRPNVPVVCATPSHGVRRQLALNWGVHANYAEVAEGDATTVVERAVQAAVDSGEVESGDTVVVLVGMMTDLEGASTTNTLKVHVAAETLVAGQSVVDGRTTGRAFRVGDGDLSDAPENAVLLLEPGFDAEFEGDLSKISAIVSADSGLTGYPAVVARELGAPMVGNADVDAVPDDRLVTVDGERGVVYRAEQ
ncbi:pyruvate kinase [Halobacterium jilantaiense]|uniref:Pyruvate kinase n=1 Tax=Halobacterium jilantaiense TaxID=355548 RepID=A0A1I0NXD1_9EURY|nr:pyruvate kinase [Halobacterium jilantaiense]SEW06319.1 pyruvate kinase [Halobacterium jilantaiense]